MPVPTQPPSLSVAPSATESQTQANVNTGPKPACESLVLDAGPLLSLSPLRGLAEHFLTVPQVLEELKDKNAREHFERLGLLTGVKIEVRAPEARALAKVIEKAKKTGDYAVLSHADLCVLALTLSLHEKEAERGQITSEGTQTDVAAQAEGDEQTTVATTEDTADVGLGEPSLTNTQEPETPSEPIEEVKEVAPIVSLSNLSLNEDDSSEQEPLDVSIEPIKDDEELKSPTASQETSEVPTGPIFEDPSDEDDGEGDWITPDNVGIHKSCALELFPSSDSRDAFTTVPSKKGRKKGSSQKRPGVDESGGQKEQIKVGCMTADFAMQNVLLQMGLNLVGLEGKRIEKVKTWVLRCHACFKICKDSSKKFCPSCGNPTLLRTSVTIKSPTASDSSPTMEVHLKRNFVFRTRGTKFAIPAPKPGTSKTGSGEGLILREDQTEYIRARKREENKREREERRLVKQSLAQGQGGESTGIRLGDWTDPDWMPEMLSVGIGGKGRKVNDSRVPLGADGMPIIGYGRKNPNERRRKR